MNMVKKNYTVRFVTPAFLGDANQNGIWRTPPFKALIRQWWRIVTTAGGNPDTASLLGKEGELFGRASGDQGNNASQVRLKLDCSGGSSTSNSWGNFKFNALNHPEVSKGNPKTDLYLGYGPVKPGGKLKGQTFIAPDSPGAERSLEVSMPGNEEEKFNIVLKLIHLFGTLGGEAAMVGGRSIWGRGGFQPRKYPLSSIPKIYRPGIGCDPTQKIGKRP